MKYLLLTIFAINIVGTPAIAQDSTASDPYQDYSYLWAEEGRKKKKKKKAKKEKPAAVAPTAVPTDSLQKKPSDSLQTEKIEAYQPTIAPILADTLDPEPVVQSADTTEAPVEEVIVEETPKEPKEPREKRGPADPIDDFRTPMASGQNGGSFTGGFTYTRIGGEDFVGLTLNPEFSIGKVGVGLNVPILYGLESGSVRTEIFEDGVGPTRLITYIRYGRQKVDPLYVKVGQLNGLMLGFGGLINNYTNTTSFEKRKVGLHYDINYKNFAGLEGMYSDFNPESRNLLAFRPYVRPLAYTGIPVIKTLEMGVSFISDKDQTAIITSDSTSRNYAFTEQGANAFGIDIGMTVLKIPFVQIDLFANYSNLDIESDSLQNLAQSQGETEFSTGSGVSAGVNFRLNFIADLFHTDIRIERLRYNDHYLPLFFDATYEINKDAKIASLINAEKRSGTYGSLSGQVLQKLRLGGSLLIPDNISETSPAVVQLNADMERLADKFSLHASYIKGDLTDLSDAFKLDQRSLAQARFIYHMNKFLAAGVDYYWAFTPTEDGGFKAEQTVMPYFGLNIAF